MRTVLYADDMEPITVIDLSHGVLQFLREQGHVRLPVPMPVQLSARPTPQTPTMADIKIVTIFAERLIRKGQEHLMLFTHDEESARLLKCAFLPGQQAGLQEREREAFAKGFLDALIRACR